MRRAAFKPLGRLALERWQDTAAWMDRNYKTERGEVLILNRARGDQSPGSLSFNRETGQWADFATGDKGADLVGMGKMVLGFSTMTEAAESLAQHLGISESDLEQMTPGNSTQKKKRHTLGPVPQAALDALAGFERWAQKNHATGVYQVKNPAGELLLLRVRQEPPGEDKTYKPFSWNPETGLWMAGGDFGRLFYGLERLASKPGASVLIVEGEKTADAAVSVFPDLVVLGLMGSNACRMVELEPLNGRDVTLWPDADVPGFEAMRTLEARLLQFGNRVHQVVLPEPILGWTKPGKAEPGGWDLADQVPEGVDLQSILDAAVVSQLPRNSAPAGPLFPGQTVEVETPPTAVADAELAQLGMDEMGLMHRFISRWGATTRWCPSWGSWLAWDGRRWTKDDSAAKARATRTINVLLDEAQTLPEGERRIAFVKWVGTILSNAARKRNALLTLAADELVIDASLMDVDPWLLNCANGVLNLRTGELSPHDPSLFLSKLAPVEYPTQPVDCPGWKQFLHTVMDGNQVLVDFLQKAAGYTLTGETSDRSFFVLNGVGRNGKGVFKETVRDIMGDYAVNIAHRVITGENEHDTDALGLQGARFAEASEPGGKKWKAATLKRLTGQDTVDGRHMGANDRIEFRPVCKIWILANTDELPNTDSGDAFWDRLRLINFPVRFVREDEAGYDSTPPEHREVPDLKKKLQAEFPAILRWMVEGCIQWQRDGVLRVPQEIKTAVADYRAEQTPLRTFIEERCIIHPDARVTNQLLQVAYDQWAQRNGEPTLSGKMLTRTIQADAAWFQNTFQVTPVNDNTTRTSTARWWHGIGLREPVELKGNQGRDDR